MHISKNKYIYIYIYIYIYTYTCLYLSILIIIDPQHTDCSNLTEIRWAKYICKCNHEMIFIYNEDAQSTSRTSCDCACVTDILNISITHA